MKIQKLAQSGRSMVEMLGVLAIIGVLSVGGIAGYSKAMFQYRINKDIEIISQTVTNMQTLYASQSGDCKYGGGKYMCDKELDECWCTETSDDFPESLRKQVLPEGSYELSMGASIWVNWVGIYHDIEEYYKNSNTRGFVIYLSGLSKKECVALATYDWGNRTTGLIGYSAGDNAVADLADNRYITYNCSGGKNIEVRMWDIWNVSIACPGGSVVGVPMPVSVATNACADCEESENGCEVDFIFE